MMIKTQLHHEFSRHSKVGYGYARVPSVAVSMSNILKNDDFSPQEIWLSLLLIPLGLCLGESIAERILLVSSVVMVLMTQALSASDFGRVKDNAPLWMIQIMKSLKSEDVKARTMLMVLMITGLIWIMIGLPKLL